MATTRETDSGRSLLSSSGGVTTPYEIMSDEPPCAAPEKRRLTPKQVTIHLLKANIGPGVLALPLHFAAVGSSVGCAALAVVAAQGIWGSWLLVSMQRRVESLRTCPARRLDFEDLGEIAFGRAGRTVVRGCVLVLQLGICSVQLALVGDNMQAEIPPLGRTEAVLLAWAAEVVLLCTLHDLAALAPLSGLGTAAMLVALTTVSAFAVMELAGLGPAAAGSTLEPLGDGGSDESLSLATLAGSTSALFYAFEGVACVLPVGNSLAPPHVPRYGFLLLRALGVVLAAFAVSATLTALAYPDIDEASSIAYLTRRYASTPHAAVVRAAVGVANILVAAACAASFPLQLTPAALIIEGGCGLRSLRACVAARVAAATGCCALVLLVPNLSALIDLVGSVATTALAALPCLIHAKLVLTRPSFRGDAPAGCVVTPPLPCDENAATEAAVAAVATTTSAPDRDDEPLPPLRASQWAALCFDAAVVLFCACVFIVGLYESLDEVGVG